MLLVSLNPVPDHTPIGAEYHGQLAPDLIPPPELYPILIAVGLALGLIAVIALRGMAAFGRYSRRRGRPEKVLLAGQSTFFRTGRRFTAPSLKSLHGSGFFSRAAASWRV